MIKKDKDFYVWTMAECIKEFYEWWGADMMSMYSNIKEDFPNAAIAIQKMHNNFKESDVYEAQYRFFKRPRYVYQVIENLIPLDRKIKYDIRTKEQDKKYKKLNMCCVRKRFVSIRRIDLLMAALLFTEEFILMPVTSRNVILSDTKITVYGNFVTFKVSKHEEKTYISIRIRNVMLLQYMILN